MNDIFDDVFAAMDAFWRYPETDRSLMNRGLHGIIKIPHNLYTVKNDKGDVEKQILEVVYTPFAAKDVAVDIENNVLTIKIGNENFKTKDSESMVYHGISNQCREFAIKLSNKCDISKIAAQAVDGILRIEIPFMKEVKPETIRIPVSIGAEEQKKLA